MLNYLGFVLFHSNFVPLTNSSFPILLNKGVCHPLAEILKVKTLKKLKKFQLYSMYQNVHQHS